MYLSGGRGGHGLLQLLMASERWCGRSTSSAWKFFVDGILKQNLLYSMRVCIGRGSKDVVSSLRHSLSLLSYVDLGYQEKKICFNIGLLIISIDLVTKKFRNFFFHCPDFSGIFLLRGFFEKNFFLLYGNLWHRNPITAVGKQI